MSVFIILNSFETTNNPKKTEKKSTLINSNNNYKFSFLKNLPYI